MIFITNFVYVLTNKGYKTYQMRFLFCCLDHTPGVGLGGVQGSSFSNMVMYISNWRVWRVEQNANKILP